MVMRLGGLLATTVLLALASNGSGADNGDAARVDQARLEAAASDADNWLTYGRTYAEQRFSELARVNDGNIGQLGLAWATELDTARGQEATPIVVDGIMYTSTAWSKVLALDAAKGKVLW